LAGRVRGTLAQRLHVLVGRVVLAVLCLSSLTALFMSSTTLELVQRVAGLEPDVVSAVGNGSGLPVAQLPVLQSLTVQDLRKLNFPSATDPEDIWKVTTSQGQGWIDRYSGQTLAWQDATMAQRVYDWAVVLHTGESAWPWAAVPGHVGASNGTVELTSCMRMWRARCYEYSIT